MVFACRCSDDGAPPAHPEMRLAPSIVCAIDASPQAQAALHVASALAERLRLRLVVLHAVPAPTPDLLLTAPTRVPADIEQCDLIGRDAGERLLSRAAETHDLSGAKRRLENGSAAARACAVAREEEAELVVVGSRGAGPLHAAVLGSVSIAVARDAPCPVVVVPPGMSGAPLEGERIVCGVDTGADGPAVATAARLARGLHVPLTLTHVLPGTPEAFAGVLPATFDQRRDGGRRHALQMIHRLLQDSGEGLDADLHEVRLRRGDAAGQLLELADSARAMLLVVGSRGRGPLRGGLLGSVSRELVRHANRPVVICRQEEPT